jgi:anti-sigma regulatory factor (Ser/Thr protein kinase)
MFRVFSAKFSTSFAPSWSADEGGRRVNEDVEPQSGYTSPPPGAPVKSLLFRLPDLPEVRQFAEEEARAVGMPEEVIGDFVIAVNEVATNAVNHGAADARMRTWVISGDLIVEVHDEGTWKPGPMPGAVGGMGLWVARLLSSDLTLRVGSGGSTVIMRFPGKG